MNGGCVVCMEILVGRSGDDNWSHSELEGVWAKAEVGLTSLGQDFRA